MIHGKIRLLGFPTFYPKNPSLPVAVPPRGTYASGKPGWLSTWHCDMQVEVAPWTIGDDIALQQSAPR